MDKITLMIGTVFNKLINKFIRSKDYVHFDSKNTKSIYISYIADVFYQANNEEYMNFHQNRREALIIYEYFKRLGYNIVIQNYNSSCRKYLNKSFDIVFGLEPNFTQMALANPKSLNIYYATGAYFLHQNRMIYNRTIALNKKYNVSLGFSRLVEEHNSVFIADYILQIGSKFTISSYPIDIQDKIRLITQSSNLYIEDKVEFTACRDHFIWFGSSGSILKGLDLVLEVFKERKDLKLHVIGPIDADFDKYVKPLFNEENIFFYGFLNVNSSIFKEIVRNSCFCIYPSGSEGGIPGSVIALMKYGVIPIVSKWASFDNIFAFGFQIEDINTDSINNAINIALSKSDLELADLRSKCAKYARSVWTLNQFENSFSESLNSIISTYYGE